MPRPNRYCEPCVNCGEYVMEGAGVSYKENGKWITAHNYGECPVKPAELNPYEGFELDDYQQAVRDSLVTGVRGPHIMVCARAGSGKTTVQCFSLWDILDIDPALSVAMIAFGHEDGERIKARCPKCVDGATTHSLGLRLIRDFFPGTKINNRKTMELVEAVCGAHDEAISLRNYVRELLSKIKADAIRADNLEGMSDLIQSYDLDIPFDYRREAIQKANEALKLGMDLETWGVNFDDMIYLVAILDIPIPEYDIVAIDEVQDLCRSQIIFLGKLVVTGARVIAVGDPQQSLYLFRGARPDSFYQVRRLLETTDRGVVNLGMPICYRQSRAIIRHAQQWVPELQARPDAPEGEIILGYPIKKMIEHLRPGDCVISRTNGPLAQVSHILGVQGIPFYMRGGRREAGWINWLIDLLSVERGPTQDIKELLKRLAAWLEEKRQRCKPMKYAEYASRSEVITVFGKQSESVDDLKKRVKALYRKPKNIDDCIIISTIHLAKGSEAENIWHIHPENCPHPLAKTKDQQDQEQNAMYVAVTRGKDKYIECKGVA